MHIVMHIAGSLAVLASLFFLSVARSDIQIGIAVTALIGAVTLFGLGAMLSRLKALQDRAG